MSDEVCINCGCRATAACWVEDTSKRTSWEGPCNWSPISRLCSACDPEFQGAHRRVDVRRIDVLMPNGSGRKRVGLLLFHPERKFWRYQPLHRYSYGGIDSHGLPDTLTTPISDPNLRRLKRHLGRVVVYRETDRHPRR